MDAGTAALAASLTRARTAPAGRRGRKPARGRRHRRVLRAAPPGAASDRDRQRHALAFVGQRRISPSRALTDNDEIGEMARALEVFRAQRDRTPQLCGARSAPTQSPSSEHAAAIGQIIGEFRGTITERDPHRRRQRCPHGGHRARRYRQSPHEADEQARAASVSSETTSANVQTVAGAADQLGDFDPRDQRPGRRSPAASFTAPPRSPIRRHNWSANCLRGADRIGDVVMLITRHRRADQPAGAQRHHRSGAAGEAGRGFAVVAAEVKALASQTAQGHRGDRRAGRLDPDARPVDAVEAIRSIAGVYAATSMASRPRSRRGRDSRRSSTQMIAQQRSAGRHRRRRTRRQHGRSSPRPSTKPIVPPSRCSTPRRRSPPRPARSNTPSMSSSSASPPPDRHPTDRRPDMLLDGLHQRHRPALVCRDRSILAATAIALAANSPAGAPADEDAQIANSLANMLRASRTVVSRHQDNINDATLATKASTANSC